MDSGKEREMSCRLSLLLRVSVEILIRIVVFRLLTFAKTGDMQEKKKVFLTLVVVLLVEGTCMFEF